jgi:thiamine biosynthesis lipoprotein
MEWYEFRAMNTDILLGAEGRPAAIAQGFRIAVAYIQTEEARLTRFSEESELTRLNLSSGAWFHASNVLFEILQEARVLFDETDGLFDPSILDVLESIGYDKSMDEIRAHGTSTENAIVPIQPHHFREVQFDEAAQAILLPAGMRLDLGGIAKGWIAERAAQVLAQYSSACVVNAGGDLFAMGHPSEEGAWLTALEDPRDEERVLAVLRTGPGAVATSSILRRRWRQGDAIRHHLIDPRRRAAAETDWLCVTVIAPHAAVAEAYAKALLIAGPGSAPSLAERRGDIAYIAVDMDSQLWGSNNAKGYLDV